MTRPRFRDMTLGQLRIYAETLGIRGMTLWSRCDLEERVLTREAELAAIAEHAARRDALLQWVRPDGGPGEATRLNALRTVAR